MPITHGREIRAIRVGPAVLTETNHPPHTRLAPHVHERACFTYVVDGWFFEDFGDERLRCTGGTVLYKPAGTAHANRYGDEGARSLIVEFEENDAIARRGPQALGGVHRFRDGRIGDLARQMMAELRLMDAASAIILDGLVRVLIGHTMRACAEPVDRRPPGWLQAVHQRIREDFADCPSLARLAGEAGVHPDHLTRCFKEHYGMLIGDFVRSLRLEAAARHLAHTDMSISSIAYRLGFADQSHLTRLFKRHYATTPARYRASQIERDLRVTDVMSEA